MVITNNEHELVTWSWYLLLTMNLQPLIHELSSWTHTHTPKKMRNPIYNCRGCCGYGIWYHIPLVKSFDLIVRTYDIILVAHSIWLKLPHNFDTWMILVAYLIWLELPRGMISVTYLIWLWLPHNFDMWHNSSDLFNFTWNAT